MTAVRAFPDREAGIDARLGEVLFPLRLGAGSVRGEGSVAQRATVESHLGGDVGPSPPYGDPLFADVRAREQKTARSAAREVTVPGQDDAVLEPRPREDRVVRNSPEIERIAPDEPQIPGPAGRASRRRSSAATTPTLRVRIALGLVCKIGPTISRFWSGRGATVWDQRNPRSRRRPPDRAVRHPDLRRDRLGRSGGSADRRRMGWSDLEPRPLPHRQRDALARRPPGHRARAAADPGRAGTVCRGSAPASA